MKIENVYKALYGCALQEKDDSINSRGLGILHENGYLYATDNYVCARVHYEEYDFDLEGISVGKDHKEINRGKSFSNVEAVLKIACKSERLRPAPDNTWEAIIKAPIGERIKHVVCLKIEDLLFHTCQLKKAISLFESVEEIPEIFLTSLNAPAMLLRSKSCEFLCINVKMVTNTAMILTPYNILTTEIVKPWRAIPLQTKRNLAKPMTPKMKKQAEDIANEKLNLLSALSQINAVIVANNPGVEIKEEKEDRTSDARRSMTISDSHKGKFYVKQNRYVLSATDKEKTIAALSAANVNITDSGEVTIPTGKGSITFMFIAAIDVENKVRINYPSSAKIEPYTPSKELGNPKSTFFLNSKNMRDKDNEVLARRELNLENIEHAKQNGMFGLAKVFQEEMDRLSIWLIEEKKEVVAQ